MSNYDEVTSPHILQRIAETSWEDHDEIDGLILFEKLLRHGVNDFGSGMAFGGLRNRYIKDYPILAAEISPENFKIAMENIESIARSENRRIEYGKQKIAQEALDRQSWKRAGGRASGPDPS